MRFCILDMYGVVVSETGDGVLPWLQAHKPDLTAEEVWRLCDLADVGELTSLEVWARLGFTGDLEAFERGFLDGIRLNEGFREFASAVRSQGKLALLSNDSSRWSAYLRQRLDLNGCFDVISVSGDLGMKKPDPRIYLRTMELLGARPEDCVYVDDRRSNLNTAAALGMETVLFNTRQVEWKGKSVGSFPELARLLKIKYE